MRQVNKQARLHTQSGTPQPNGDLVGMSERASALLACYSGAGAARDRTDGVARSTGWRLAFEGE